MSLFWNLIHPSIRPSIFYQRSDAPPPGVRVCVSGESAGVQPSRSEVKWGSSAPRVNSSATEPCWRDKTGISVRVHAFTGELSHGFPVGPRSTTAELRGEKPSGRSSNTQKQRNNIDFSQGPTGYIIHVNIKTHEIKILNIINIKYKHKH